LADQHVLNILIKYLSQSCLRLLYTVFQPSHDTTILGRGCGNWFVLNMTAGYVCYCLCRPAVWIVTRRFLVLSPRTAGTTRGFVQILSAGRCGTGDETVRTDVQSDRPWGQWSRPLWSIVRYTIILWGFDYSISSAEIIEVATRHIVLPRLFPLLPLRFCHIFAFHVTIV
jgi:hypothetical protein